MIALATSESRKKHKASQMLLQYRSLGLVEFGLRLHMRQQWSEAKRLTGHCRRSIVVVALEPDERTEAKSKMTEGFRINSDSETVHDTDSCGCDPGRRDDIEKAL